MSLEVQHFPIIDNKKEKIIAADDRVLSTDDDTSKSDNLDNNEDKKEELEKELEKELEEDDEEEEDDVEDARRR